MSCKLSIIVPVYKVEPYLHKCIDSIITQTFTNFQLVLVDDGSPDRCGEICDEYAKKDNRIIVIHKENGGLSSARNAGLDIAKGEYIGFIDSDDYIEKDMYETLYKLIMLYDADVAECAFTKLKDDEIKIVSDCNDTVTGDNLFALNKLATFGLHSVVCNKLYKKHLFSGLRFPNGKIHEDEFVMHKIFFLLKKYVYTGKSKYFYVQRPGSIMDEGFSIKTLNRLEAIEDRFYYLTCRIKDQSVINLVEFRYFNEIADIYYKLSSNNQLDSDKKYRKGLRKHILKNYEGFIHNKLLVKYRRWIMLVKINGTLFEVLFNISRNVLNWYYNTRYKCAMFVRRQMGKA